MRMLAMAPRGCRVQNIKRLLPRKRGFLFAIALLVVFLYNRTIII